MIPSNQDFLRLRNLSMITRLIWQYPGISRSELSRRLGLHRTSVARMVTLLLDKGLVQEIGEGNSTQSGGRKPVLCVINKEFGCVLGIELLQDRAKVAVSAINGEMLNSFETEMPQGDDFETRLIGLLDKIMLTCRDISIPILAINFALPGYINCKKGIIYLSNPLRVRDYRIKERIFELYGIPVFVNNDANCCAYGHIQKELNNSYFLYFLGRFHKKRCETDMDYNLGIGIGIVVNDRLYYGNDQVAGEFVSSYRRYDENIEKNPANVMGLSNEVIYSAEKDPDSLIRIFNELIHNITLLITVFNPGTIYFGGDFNRYQHMILREVEKAKQLWSNFGMRVPRFSFVDSDSFDVSRGGCEMALSEFYTVPTGEVEDGAIPFDLYSIFERLENPISPSNWPRS